MLTADGAVERVELPEKFSSAEFVSIFEDRNKTIWFGSNGNGMLSINRYGDMRSFTIRQGLAYNMVNCFYEDNEGTLWMGTEAGLAVYINNKFKIYDSSNGLNFNGIFRILPDDQRNVWLSGNFGLQRIAVDDMLNLKNNPDSTASISAQHYGTADGMKNAETNGGVFPAGWRMSNGDIWFPTVEGVAIVKPRLMNNENNPVNIHVEAMRYGNVEKTILKNIEVPAGVYNIEITYAAIDFSMPHSVNYFYRLVGLEDEWIRAGNRKTAYFTNLDPGNYTFEVRAVQNGVWSETESSDFVVLPFFYQTIWFRSLLFLVFIVSGFLVKQYHTRYQQESKLKALVNERTAALLKSNKRLQSAMASIELQNQKLLKIAWTQSHVVRAPLARMLGLLDLIRNYNAAELDLPALLALLEKSGKELDLIIRDIVKQSEIVSGELEEEVNPVDTGSAGVCWTFEKGSQVKG